jgi:two-component system response regulator AtoC
VTYDTANGAEAGAPGTTGLATPGRAMRAVYEMAERVAETDATVLVWGESGVGKERVARMLHARSPRARGPLVLVNCAALPADLLESELFGYDRGAFTGAHRDKPGKFELADGGTILLDEIGELPMPLQAKLLCVLEDGRFSRLGGHGDVGVDVRVVALTNRNLARLVTAGQFREDLYYRLDVVTIHVPPLRERRDEIPALVEHFLRLHATRYRRPTPAISEDLSRRFQQHAWPGNVRELENLVKRLVVLGMEDGVVEELDARPTVRPPAPGRALPVVAPRAADDAAAREDGQAGGQDLGLKEIIRRAARAAERQALERALEEVRWNRGEAARRLGISYTALLYKIKQHGLG